VTLPKVAAPGICGARAPAGSSPGQQLRLPSERGSRRIRIQRGTQGAGSLEGVPQKLHQGAARLFAELLQLLAVVESVALAPRLRISVCLVLSQQRLVCSEYAL
jgi:hypothetical protein